MRTLALTLSLLLAPAAFAAEDGWWTHSSQSWPYELRFPPGWKVMAPTRDKYDVEMVAPGGLEEGYCRVSRKKHWFLRVVSPKFLMKKLTKKKFQEHLRRVGDDDATVHTRTFHQVEGRAAVAFEFEFTHQVNGAPAHLEVYSLTTVRGNKRYSAACAVVDGNYQTHKARLKEIVHTFRVF